MKKQYDFKNTHLMYFHNAQWIPLTPNDSPIVISKRVLNTSQEEYDPLPPDPNNVSDDFTGTTIDPKWTNPYSFTQDDELILPTMDTVDDVDYIYQNFEDDSDAFEIVLKVDVTNQSSYSTVNYCRIGLFFNQVDPDPFTYNGVCFDLVKSAATTRTASFYYVVDNVDSSAYVDINFTADVFYLKFIKTGSASSIFQLAYSYDSTTWNVCSNDLPLSLWGSIDNDYYIGIGLYNNYTYTTKGIVDTSRAEESFALGNYLYVADSSSGLRVINIEDKYNPFIEGTYDPGTMEAVGIYVVYPYAYVCFGTSGLYIINVSDPSSPSLMGIYNSPGTASDVFVEGNYAYLADGNSGLRIVNVSNPASPTSVGVYSASSASGVVVADDYAYINTNTIGIRIIDVSNPASPSLVGTLNTFVGEQSALQGDYLYACASTSIKVIDISNKNSPTLAATYTTSGTTYDVSISGNYLFIADGSSGVLSLNISDPLHPALSSSYNTAGTSYGVFNLNNYLYISDGTTGIQILDITDPSTLTPLQEVSDYGLTNFTFDDLVFEREVETPPPDLFSCYLGSTPFYSYNFEEETWNTFDYDYNLIDEWIINTGYSLGDTSRQLEIVGYATVTHEGTEYASYLFNYTQYVLDVDELDYCTGQNIYWSWQETTTQPTDSHYYFTTKYSFTDIDKNPITSVEKIKFINNTVVVNNVKEEPLYIQNLQNTLKLNEGEVLDKIYIDYKITSATSNNYIGLRLVDEEDKEWLYSTTNSRWEYIGQVGGQFATGSTEYQTITFMNTYITSFTVPETLGIKLKVTSDSNDITLYRIVFFYTDSFTVAEETVTISGTIKDLELTKASTTVKAYITPYVPQNTTFEGREVILSDDLVEDSLDSTGSFSFTVPKNIKIYITIPTAGIRKLIEVGEEDIDLGDLTL